MIGAYVVMPVSLSDERAIFYLVLDVAVDCKPSAHRNGRGAAATERPRRLARQRADRAARQLFGHSMARRLARASPRGRGGSRPTFAHETSMFCFAKRPRVSLPAYLLSANFAHLRIVEYNGPSAPRYPSCPYINSQWGRLSYTIPKCEWTSALDVNLAPVKAALRSMMMLSTRGSGD